MSPSSFIPSEDAMIPHSRPWLDASDHEAIALALSEDAIAQGARVRAFETEVARYVGVSDGVAVASGTAALLMALSALEIGSGDEVILPTYVCEAVLDAVLTCGATPVLADVGPTWGLTVESVSERVSSRTAAILVVHPFGIAMDTRSFAPFGVPIIEDACQAFGARREGDIAGTTGTIGVFSFHATKCLTTGEGGMAVSRDPDLLDRMRRLREGHSSIRGKRIAAPLSDLQAALGLSQLERYPAFLARRRELADRYFQELADLPVRLPETVREHSMFFRFPLAVSENVDALIREFQGHGVHVRRGVDALLHHKLGLSGVDFPQAERLYETTLSIPLYPALSDDEQRSVVKACRAVWRAS